MWQLRVPSDPRFSLTIIYRAMTGQMVNLGKHIDPVEPRHYFLGSFRLLSDV